MNIRKNLTKSVNKLHCITNPCMQTNPRSKSSTVVPLLRDNFKKKGGPSKEVMSDEGEFSMRHMCICSQQGWSFLSKEVLLFMQSHHFSLKFEDECGSF